MLSLAFAAFLSVGFDPPFPVVTGETLNEQSLSLPSSLAGRPAILCVGFSRASQNRVSIWADQARKQFVNVPVFVIAELEDAPRFVRPMAIHGMKSGTPQNQRSHFVVLTSNEKEIKTAVHFGSLSDAYIVLIDPAGRIVWSYVGVVSETAMAALREVLNRLKP